MTKLQSSKKRKFATEENISVGNRLRLVRKACDITQKELAERLFCSPDLISLIERGLTPLTKQNAEFICYSFNISYKWLVEGKGQMYNNITKNLSIKDKEIERLIGKLMKMSSQDILFIENMADKIIQKNKELLIEK